jgi:hypothetical protein
MQAPRTTRHRAAAIWRRIAHVAIGAVRVGLEQMLVLGFISLMKTLMAVSALALLAACTTHTPYGPARSDGAKGYASQKIEQGRYRISYTDADAARSHDMALLRAAEITLQEGADWFEITGGYTDQDPGTSGPRSSVSLGGSRGSYGSGVGMGVGIGIPLGSSGSDVTTVIDIVTGKGEKPDRTSVYDARSVDINLRGNAP